MEFVRGTIIGMVAGICVGYIEQEMICDLMKKGKKELKKFKRKMSL